MQIFIHFLRTNKLARFFLVVLVLVSLTGLAAHHHEAGESNHDCAVCRIVQTLFTLLSCFVTFLLTEHVQQKNFLVPKQFFQFTLTYCAVPSNRAPPSRK